jgi:hypothetical protein
MMIKTPDQAALIDFLDERWIKNVKEKLLKLWEL